MDVIKLFRQEKRTGRISGYWTVLQNRRLWRERKLYLYVAGQILPQAADQNANWQVRRACDYIKEYYRKDLNLTEVARYRS